jgi:peroxiredoxin
MANALTGDFDVVAQFSITAVNRVLAAMHQTERFLHTISAHIDDNPHPGRPTIVGVVDAFGDALANQLSIGSPSPSTGPAALTDPVRSRLGTLLNPDVVGFGQPPITPSHMSGNVQLQVFPPTLVSPTAAGGNLTMKTNLVARYFPDAGSAPLAEFIRGDLQISAPISRVVSGRFHVLDINFKADDAVITFTPSYSSQPLSTEDIAGINLCIQNGLRTSFLPSSVVLPNIANVNLRTLPGALALLLDFDAYPSNPASVTNGFLADQDGFAFGVGRDYVLAKLQAIAQNILQQQFPDIRFTVDLSLWGVGTTLHYDYPVALNSASFDLSPGGHDGKVVLTIQATVGPEVHGHPFGGPYNPTITVEFSLQPSGNTVQLALGNVNVDPHSTAADIAQFFTTSFASPVRDGILQWVANSDIQTTMDQTFNTDTNLAQFLNAQFRNPDGTTPAHPQQVFLTYTSAQIQSAGIVLHGSVYVQLWADPQIQFEQIPVHHSSQTQPFAENDYSALKSWIPGGTITEYDWSRRGQATPFEVDPNKFVLQDSTVVGSAGAEAFSLVAYSPICLTVRGNRISSYSDSYDQVSTQVCGTVRFPVGGLAIDGITVSPPLLAMTRSGPAGETVISGHVAAQVDRSGNTAPNLIVHFADEKSISQLHTLTRAVQEAKRSDAPTAIITLVSADMLAKARFTPGITYADDRTAWSAALRLKDVTAPFTAIVDPKGTLLWKREGPIEPESLVSALRKHLVKRSPVRLTVPRLNARIGQPAPAFLFEYSPGRDISTNKLKGQGVVLVFWRRGVPTSIDAVRSIHARVAKAKPQAIVLAINDGDNPEAARAAAAESHISATLVIDPKREISAAFGVSIWPTIVMVSATGIVTGIRYGHMQPERSTAPGTAT